MRFFKEKTIIGNSGNYLWVEAYKKKTITPQEYRDAVKLLRVVEFDTKEEALEYEPKAIQECKEKYGDLCVNICKGNKYGSIGFHHCEETKQRLREIKTGVGNSWYGKQRSEETKERMKQSFQSVTTAYRNNNPFHLTWNEFQKYYRENMK